MSVDLVFVRLESAKIVREGNLFTMATDEDKPINSSNAQERWEAFMSSVEEELKRIQSDKVDAVQLETEQLNTFVGYEHRLFTKAMELGGIPLDHSPINWDKILSVPPNEAGIFYQIILATLAEPTFDDISNKLDHVEALRLLHDAFAQSYKEAHPKPSSEEELIYWVSDTVIRLTDVIPTELQLKLLTDTVDGLNAIIFAADLRTSHWNNFEKPEEESGGKARGIWPEHFAPAIEKLLNREDEAGKDIEENARRVIRVLKAKSPSYSLSLEVAARSWVQGSIMGMKPEKWLTNERKREMIANLEKEITSLFPQPDKAYFYDNFQDALFQHLFDPAATTTLANSGFAVKKQDQESKIKLSDSEHQAAVGVKRVLDEWLEQYTQGVSEEIKEELRQSVARTIQQALVAGFEHLPLQGSQGALLTATYQRQTITRITTYLTDLLNDLAADLEKEIPANAKSSLSTAQNITSAAVSYRQFAEGLQNMNLTFKEERVRTAPDYDQMKAYMSGSDVPGEADSITDLAQLIYTGITEPEPFVKTAEAEGVQIAALASGLKTFLESNLKTDQAAALASLAVLNENALQGFTAKANTFASDIDNYFRSLPDFIQARRDFEQTNENAQIIEQVLENLTQIASDDSS